MHVVRISQIRMVVAHVNDSLKCCSFLAYNEVESLLHVFIHFQVNSFEGKACLNPRRLLYRLYINYSIPLTDTQSELTTYSISPRLSANKLLSKHLAPFPFSISKTKYFRGTLIFYKKHVKAPTLIF